MIARFWQSSTQRVMSITAVGMLMALIADILVAAKLGATALADMLIIALTVPRIIEVVAREGTKFSLVSLLVDVEQNQSEKSLLEFVAMLFNLAFLVGLLLMIIGWVLAGPIIRVTGPGLGDNTFSQTELLFRLSLPLALFAILSTILTVFLNSQKHFTITAARNMSMPAAVIVLMVLNWQNPQIVGWIAAAHTIGYFLYFLILLRYCYINTEFRVRWGLLPQRQSFSQLSQAVVYPSLGLAVRQSLRIAERALASLTAPGGVAAYYFAYRLISSLQTIIGVSLATTKLPEMSRMAVKQKRQMYEKALLKQLGQISLICLPITLTILFFHEPIIQILYGRGAFNEGSIAQTSQVLQILGISTLFLSLIPTLNAALYALQKYKLVWWNQAFNTLLNLLLAWYLSLDFGILGIAVAMVIATIASVIVQLIFLRFNRISDPIPEV